MEFTVSPANAGDIETLVNHRIGMWRELRPEMKDMLPEAEARTRIWIKDKMSLGELVGFIARTETGTVAGSGCVWVREEQPHLSSPLTRAPYLMSMFTLGEFRRKGVATEVVRRAIAWSRERGFDTLILHASDLGKPLYEGLGFKTTTEMRLKL